MKTNCTSCSLNFLESSLLFARAIFTLYMPGQCTVLCHKTFFFFFLKHTHIQHHHQQAVVILFSSLRWWLWLLWKFSQEFYAQSTRIFTRTVCPIKCFNALVKLKTCIHLGRCSLFYFQRFIIKTLFHSQSSCNSSQNYLVRKLRFASLSIQSWSFF